MPYDELDLQTTRFRLTLRRTPDGWTQSTQVLAGAQAPVDDGGAGTSEAGETSEVSDAGEGRAGGDNGGEGDGGGREVGEPGLVAVRAPLPGTFYRAPRPGAPPFVEVGSRVGADTVVAIVETMKLMNSVTAGADGTVAEICLANGEFAEHGAALMRIRADP
jgi:acetyl-CoA carboxylase biotin carboxyl carrier protein